MTIKGVSIGDRFISPTNRRSKTISTVIDFVERKSLTTGKVIGYECWAEHEFIGQKIKVEVPFASVIRNKLPYVNK